MVDVDGPVHVLDMGGPVDGPLLVGLHGLGGSHLNWSAIGPELTRRSRVMALDLVGHGLTPVGARRADIEGHRRLVSGFLRMLGGAPVILMGNSMGGLVAALQAAEEPDSVAGLILVDPALPTARLGLVHPRVIANFLLCAVPGVGEGYLSQRRRHTTAEQSVHRVLDVCCVDPAKIPRAVVEAHVALTERMDRTQADAAYLRSARSLSMILARPAARSRRPGPAHAPPAGRPRRADAAGHLEPPVRMGVGHSPGRRQRRQHVLGALQEERGLVQAVEPPHGLGGPGQDHRQ